MKKVGTAPDRVLARIKAELRSTDRRHQEAMITKETREFIVKRMTKVEVKVLRQRPPTSCCLPYGWKVLFVRVFVVSVVRRDKSRGDCLVGYSVAGFGNNGCMFFVFDLFCWIVCMVSDSGDS